MFSQAALNASLNGISALLLAGGYAAIRAGKRDVHKAFMIGAFSVSTVFLASYVLYHIRVGHVVLFQGQGWIRPVYFTLLTSHTILDRKSTRLNSSHGYISYAVFCLKKKKYRIRNNPPKFLRVTVSLRPSGRVRSGSTRDCMTKPNVASMTREVRAAV